MTSDSAHVRGVVTPLADWDIDVGHGEPHQRRQAAVAAGVPASVKTIVRAAARIMALSVRRRHPEGVTPLAQALVTPQLCLLATRAAEWAFGAHLPWLANTRVWPSLSNAKTSNGCALRPGISIPGEPIGIPGTASPTMAGRSFSKR